MQEIRGNVSRKRGLSDAYAASSGTRVVGSPSPAGERCVGTETVFESAVREAGNGRQTYSSSKSSGDELLPTKTVTRGERRVRMPGSRRAEGLRGAERDETPSQGHDSSTRRGGEDFDAESTLAAVRPDRRAGGRQPRIYEVLQGWNLRFSGAEKEDADEFLETLEACRISEGLEERGLLAVVPCVLSGDARMWFRMMRPELTSWRKFDLLADLQSRTQGKDEPVARFIACLRGILNYFETPPSAKQQVEIAYAQLRPDYRKFMDGKSLNSLWDIVKEGKRYERHLALDERFTNPPPPEKALIRAAAYTGVPRKATKPAAAAAEEKSASRQSKKTARGGNRKESASRDSTQSSSDEAAEIFVGETRGARGDERGAERGAERRTYAAVVQSPAQPNQLAITVGPPMPGVAPWQNAAETRRREWWPPQPSLNFEATRGALRFAPAAQPTAVPGPSNVQSPFYGICYECQGVGHRAVECHKRKCYVCGNLGHTSGVCPLRASADVCQSCGTVGVTLRNCPN